MLGEDNYYIPDANEFNFGMEYYCEKFMGEPLGFHPSDLRDDRIEEFLQELHDGKIKIKYLDGDDIISFNMEIANEDAHTYKCKKKLLGLGSGDDRTLFVYHEIFMNAKEEVRISTHIWWQENRGTEITVFEGSIRNKSEFRTILKQIHANTITEKQ